MAEMIQIEDLVFHYTREDEERVDAIKGVSLTIEKGSFTAIIGRNGSGRRLSITSPVKMAEPGCTGASD